MAAFGSMPDGKFGWESEHYSESYYSGWMRFSAQNVRLAAEGLLMRLTLPKPPHGWPEFAWEIGTVFVGVVLALSGERLLQQYNWRQDARQASAAIKAELAQHQLAAIERLAVQPCLKAQIRALYEKLSRHQGGKWTAMPMFFEQQATTGAAQRALTWTYRAPEPPWVDEAWQSAQSTGALNHLPAEDVSRYAQVYRRSNRFLGMQDEESDAAARLAVLATDGPIPANARVELLGALARVDHANAYIELGARQQLQLLRPLLNDLPRDKIDRAIADNIAIQRALRGPCVQPLKLNRG